MPNHKKIYLFIYYTELFNQKTTASNIKMAESVLPKAHVLDKVTGTSPRYRTIMDTQKRTRSQTSANWLCAKIRFKRLILS